MNFEQFRAKVFRAKVMMLCVWKELDQPLDEQIDELKKDLVPIRYNLVVSRKELVGILNLVKMNAESYDFVSLIKLAEQFIEKYKIK